jgi:hypothetical protein
LGEVCAVPGKRAMVKRFSLPMMMSRVPVHGLHYSEVVKGLAGIEHLFYYRIRERL